MFLNILFQYEYLKGPLSPPQSKIMMENKLFALLKIQKDQTNNEVVGYDAFLFAQSQKVSLGLQKEQFTYEEISSALCPHPGIFGQKGQKGGVNLKISPDPPQVVTEGWREEECL